MKKDTTVETVQVKGLSLELQGLSQVAAQFARFSVNDPAFVGDTELLEITVLSRRYLKCLLHKAIDLFGEEIESIKENYNEN